MQSLAQTNKFLSSLLGKRIGPLDGLGDGVQSRHGPLPAITNERTNEMKSGYLNSELATAARTNLKTSFSVQSVEELLLTDTWIVTWNRKQSRVFECRQERSDMFC